jgi:hypothetical protein
VTIFKKNINPDIHAVHAMGIIKRHYPIKLYHWPIGKTKESDMMLKWESGLNQPLVVFHPFLSFDPISTHDRQERMLIRDESEIEWNSRWLHQMIESVYIPNSEYVIPIVHEEIKAAFNFFSGLDRLLAGIERNCKTPKDERLWEDTGYWTARSGRFGYMGISEDGAKQIWEKSNELTMSYIASSSSILIEFRLDKNEKDTCILNVYYSNRSIVFPDLIDGLHRALDDLAPWKVVKKEMKEHDEIFNIENKEMGTMQLEKISVFPIHPVRVISSVEDPAPASDWLYAVLVKNTFFKIAKQIKPEGYAIVTRGVEWLRGDFSPGKLYGIRFSQVMKLGFCYLANVSIYEEKRL